MSYVAVYHVSTLDTPNKVLTHFDDMAALLAEQGVGFDRLQVAVRVEPGAAQADVIAACQEPIDKLMTERGYAAVDVISCSNDYGSNAERRAEFLHEYRHGGDEVRWFVAGRGLFTLRIGEYIYSIQCEKNDLLSVPSGTPRWFDIGENPSVVAIRLFKNTEDQVAHVTGDDIASRFPRLDD